MIARLRGARSGRLALFGGGLIAGMLAMWAFEKTENAYWRSPGWFLAEIPRLHAWAVRLMELGAPGRDGGAEYQIPESDWAARGGTLKECFATEPVEMLIGYASQGDELYGTYRCRIGTMVGELHVAFYGPQRLLGNGAYVFRTLEPESASPALQPYGILGR